MLYVGYAFFHFVHCQRGPEFENFDVVRSDAGFERSEIDIARARGAMIASGKLHIMNMKPGEAVAQ